MTKNKKIEWKVDGMTCANCARSVTKFLEKNKQQDVYVDFASKEVSFDVVEETNLDQLKKELKSMGYPVIDDQSKPPFWSLKKKMAFSLLFTLPLFLHMFLPHGPLHNPYVQLALCIPVFLIGIYHFGISAWHSVKNGSPNMDVLIFVGSTSAFIYSLTGTLLQLGPDYLFYETAAMIISLVLLGNVIEEAAVKKTTSSIEALQNLEARTAKRIGPNGVEQVPIHKVKIGDKLQVNLGDAVPTDGIIMSGKANINESMLTGESLAVPKSPGSQVIGASLVEEGQFQMEVTSIGSDTVLRQIISMVKAAQSKKPDIQRLADRISAIFVPVVIGIAVLTFLLSWLVFGIGVQQAMLNSIAVLVISCPCAMGLATPTAIMVGVGRAARNGVLFKGGQTMELMAKVDKVIFDKTGTLTISGTALSEFEIHNGLNRSQIASIIVEMENHSSHVLAKQLREIFKKESLESTKLEAVKEISGAGMEAKDGKGNLYRLGREDFVLNQKKEPIDKIFLSMNFEPVASFRLSEIVREESRGIIKTLKADGKEVFLLSGDQYEKTKIIAEDLGIDHFFASQNPEQKLKKIEELSENSLTAMVGDGINDAPALARATIGVSMNDASSVAIQSANVVLMGNSLTKLCFAFNISEKTLTTIKENLFWAFSYNLVAIPLAAMGFLNPMWGALFMAFSDVVVIGNSIRLNFKKLNT